MTIPADFPFAGPSGQYFVHMDLSARFQEVVSRRELLVPGDRVLVALSGGPDSVALLRLLTGLKKQLPLEIGALYLNHGIRKAAARREEAFCAELCKRLGVEFTVIREDVPAESKKRGVSLEEAGREVRYRVLEEAAGAGRYTKIALGHHADDQVETVVFRLFRGTGATGLIGMPWRRGVIVRPLLEFTKAELLAHLKRLRQPYCSDASNKSLKHTRNAIRTRLLPEARKHINLRADLAVLTLIDHVSADEAFLEEQVDSVWRKAVRVTPGGKLNLDLQVLARYHTAVRKRLLRRCVRETWSTEVNPGAESVVRLEALLVKAAGRVSLARGVSAEISSGRLWLYAERPIAYNESLEPGRKLTLDWPRLSFAARLQSSGRIGDQKRPRARQVVLDWERLEMPLTVRSIKPGDRFVPLGLAGSKKIGDYLTDRKVPRPMREEIPVVCDKAGIVWLVGQEIADRVKITSATRKVLRVEYRVRQGYHFTAV